MLYQGSPSWANELLPGRQLALNSLDQRGHRSFERVSQQFECRQARAPFTPFEQADVSLVGPSEMGKLLLGEPSLLASRPQDVPEYLRQSAGHLTSRRDRWNMRPYTIVMDTSSVSAIPVGERPPRRNPHP